MPAIAVPTTVRGVDPAVMLTLPPAARIRCTVLDGFDALRFALTSGTPAGCIVAAELDPGLRRQLDRILLDVPDAYLVVGLESKRSGGGAARPTSTRVTMVSPLPDPARMAQALRVARFEGRRAELLRRLDEAPLHWLVKQAVRTVLAQDLTSGTPPVHSIEALATCCGTDRAGLWRARRGADLDLARLIFLWVVLLALRERFLPTSFPPAPPTSLQIARRCGYSGTSGLTSLLVRELGHGLRHATLSDLWRTLETLEGMLANAGRTL